jgi:hypothetical protein
LRTVLDQTLVLREWSAAALEAARVETALSGRRVAVVG